MPKLNIQSEIKKIDWDFTNAETQYLTHAVHRYSGKFIPQIAQAVIKLTTKTDDLVLDLFCGSGTTLLECALNKRKSIGVDLNPLAVLISKTKTTPIKASMLDNFYTEIEEYSRGFSKNESLNLDLFEETGQSSDEIEKAVTQDFRWQDNWFVKWFREEIRFELIALYRKIATYSCSECRNIGFTAFSDILRKSSNAHSSYPNVMFDKNKTPPPLPTPRFLERLKEIISAVKKLDDVLKPDYIPIVIRSNANCLPLPDCSIDAVITHPPYIGSIPYAEYGILSLGWLGHDHKYIDKILTGGKRQSKDVVERFRNDFRMILAESWRVLRPGKTLFLMVGNPTVKGQRIDLCEMTKELALPIGFKLQGLHTRNGINRRANLMGLESLMFFQK